MYNKLEEQEYASMVHKYRSEYVTTSIDLTIEKLEGEDLYMTYDEGFRNNPLVNGLLAFLPKWEVGAVELYQRSKAIVHLAKIN